MRGDAHVRFGRRAGETGQPKGRYRVPARPHPPDGHAWQFTVLVTDAGVALAGPPGARAMQAMPVGTFVQPDGSTVWVVRHLIVVTERMLEHVTRAATVMVQRLGVSDDHRVYRSHLRTTTEALRAFVEVAVTIGDPDSVG